ncbi:MAG: hydantoinase/oxoprolinase family protein [Rhodobacteraceae bacterium]|jgi:N-methylhydantoinase A|nr:hydantoinase/oxoprolinase family protein [Paracoccaceae bacterium]
MSNGIMIGVDVGGTFTDVFVLDEATGQARVAKVPTTRPDQSGGFLDGISQQVSDLSGVAVVVHGTTAGTNALLERKGAKIGVITTQGLRDVLEMRRRDRPRTWGLRGDFKPVVTRDMRSEVPERTLADGRIYQPVDLDAVRAAAHQLLENGAQAVAILFANAYANPENERLAVQAVREIWPNPHVSASHEILPEIREYERFSTTALNAYLQPEVSGYLDRLETALKGGGFDGEFMIVQSNGGVMAVDTACRLPVRTALSGPAAGVIAAAYIAQTAGYPDVITGDMGGTSFDVSLIAGGQSMLSPQTSIDFGMVVRTPMIEITTIGAGGGSIAWVDKGGLLNIGPESAGSNPGPVAYGLGNTRPTVTDANVVLGRIDPDNPIGGKLTRLDVEAARRAIDTHVGQPLGLETIAAAEAILRVANARMAGAIRLVSIERGFDPKRFAFMPFGGGGALHTAALINDVGLGRAIVPRYPGVTSAMGCVIADMRQDFVQTINALADGLDESALAAFLQDHVSRGHTLLKAARTSFERTDVVVELDMAYLGQTHTVAVPLAVAIENGTVVPPTRAQIGAAFDQAYMATYGRLLPNGTRRVMNLRTSVIGRRPKFELATLAPQGGTIAAAHKGQRQVHFGDRWHDTAIYQRLALPVGAEIHGPAILEQPDTTVLVDPGLVARVDAFGNTIIERTGG